MNNRLIVFKEPNLKDYNKILIFPHIMPDGDCIGSALAMYFALKSMKKEVYVVLDDELPDNLVFLDSDENGNKIIVKSEYIKENNIEYDFCITVDLSNPDRLGSREEFIKNHKVWNIDHHKTNLMFGDYYTVIGDLSSACEVIYGYFERYEINITALMARALYTGISTDTGSFKYSSTTSRTLYIVSKLMEKMTDFNKTIIEVYFSNSKEMLQLQSLVFNHMKFIKNDKIAISYIDNKMLEKTGAKMDMSEGIVEEMLNIKGVQVSCILKEKSYGIKVSLRSKEDVDVSKIAFNHNGGGHQKAAGFNIYKNMNEAIEYMENLLNNIEF